MGQLDGQAAVVTGTAQGIGRAIADLLQAQGATVHRVDKDTVDLREPGAVDAFFAGLGELDILVNNAGGVQGQTHTPVDELTDAAWDAVLDANLRTTFNCTRAAARLMKPARYGRIVTISSGAGRSVSLTGIQAYTSAKAGQIGFTRQMAHELGPFGITVNCIAPGFVLSNPTTQAQWDELRRGRPAGPAAEHRDAPDRPAVRHRARRAVLRRRLTLAGSAGRRSPSTAGIRSSRTGHDQYRDRGRIGKHGGKRHGKRGPRVNSPGSVRLTSPRSTATTRTTRRCSAPASSTSCPSTRAVRRASAPRRSSGRSAARSARSTRPASRPPSASITQYSPRSSREPAPMPSTRSGPPTRQRRATSAGRA